MKKAILLLGLAFATALHAQNEAEGQPWGDDFDRMGLLEDTEQGGWEQAYDELADLRANRVDINSCTREDLERLPFLSEQQIMDIMDYRDRVGRIETPVELRLIPSLEMADVDMLAQFITFGSRPPKRPPTLKTILKYGKSEATGTLHAPLYEREGDRNGYLGHKYKHWLRYNFTYGQRVKVGALGAQDAGEPFLAGKNRMGYDFYSFYFLVRDMGRLRALALGRYRLRFGMGLVLNSSFGLGKLATLSTLGRSANHIFAHSSRSEANYLQGAASTVRIARGVDLSAFASYRKIDATLGPDSASVATILRTGYHRTASEMKRRRNTSETLLGGNANYTLGGFHVGATGLWASFDRDLRPNTAQRYRRWYPAGKQFWNASVDYGYRSPRLNISGETATGNGGHVATLNSLSYQAGSDLSLMVLQRYYPYQFYPIFGETFAEGSHPNNESGVMVGGNWTAWGGAVVTFYTDCAYFAWPRYGVSQSSHSLDEFVQLSYARQHWDFLARYRFRMREQDRDDGSGLAWRHDHRGRIAVAYDGGKWGWRTQGDLSVSRKEEASVGYMVTENLCLKLRGWNVNATLGYFHTDDYNSRVYTYERGVRYNFSFPSFFGEGIRYALTARWDAGSHLTAIAKLGVTDYFDRDHIGSGLQRIDRSSQAEMDFQLCWKF